MSRSRGSSRILIIPVGAVAIVLAVASTAWACTTFVGTFTVWGDKNPAPSATKVVATGTATTNNPGMYQTISGTAYASCLTAYQPAGGASCSTNRRGSVQVTTGTAASGKLPPGTYDINFSDLNAYPTHSTWKVDCMSYSVNPPSYIYKLGTAHVNTSGVIDSADSLIGGYAGYYLPSTSWTSRSNGGESGVCVSDPYGNYGNQAPLTVI